MDSTKSTYTFFLSIICLCCFYMVPLCAGKHRREEKKSKHHTQHKFKKRKTRKTKTKIIYPNISTSEKEIYSSNSSESNSSSNTLDSDEVSKMSFESSTSNENSSDESDLPRKSYDRSSSSENDFSDEESSTLYESSTSDESLAKNREELSSLYNTAKRIQFFNDLTKDIEEQINKNIKKCQWNQCQQEFNSENLFFSHVNEHVQNLEKQVDKYNCEWKNCKNQFKTKWKKSMVSHIRRHTGEKPFKCTRFGCKYAATEKQLLDNHNNRTHTGEKPFKCYKCNYSSAYPNGLFYHKKAKYTNKESWYRCTSSNCDYKAPFKGTMNLHMRTHTGEKPFKCSWPGCKYAATQKTQLDNHIRTHTDEKPFKCTWFRCDYASTSPQGLSYHIRSKHTKENLHQCTHCDYQTPSKVNFTTHIRTHTGEKPYKCTYHGCDYASTSPQGLSSHIRSKHTKENLHQCTLCNYQTPSKVALVTHIRRHTGEKPFKCTWLGCDYAAARKHDLISHMRRKHFYCLTCNMQLNSKEEIKEHCTKYHTKKR